MNLATPETTAIHHGLCTVGEGFGDGVGNDVGEGVGTSVGASVGEGVGTSVGDGVGENVRAVVGNMGGRRRTEDDLRSCRTSVVAEADETELGQAHMQPFFAEHFVGLLLRFSANLLSQVGPWR